MTSDVPREDDLNDPDKQADGDLPPVEEGNDDEDDTEEPADTGETVEPEEE